MSNTHRPYANERYEQFCREIEEHGAHEIEHYRGRFFYEGPAVFIEAIEYEDVIRATSGRLQTDDLGKTGMVVYPR